MHHKYNGSIDAKNPSFSPVPSVKLLQLRLLFYSLVDGERGRVGVGGGGGGRGAVVCLF